MVSKLFRITLIVLLNSINCYSEEYSDKQLLEIAHNALGQWKSARNEDLAREAIREGLRGLDDSQKTRALALAIFDLDSKDHGRMRYNAPSAIEQILSKDPTIITDSSELQRMIASETNARRFYVLASIANHLMRTQKSDFVVHVAPMLFRHEPLARMSADSEYYFESLSDASFFAYEMIVRNLRILDADFVPADEKLPYPEKISILVTWLRENYPGCEQLGEMRTSFQDLSGSKAAEEPDESEKGRVSVAGGDESSQRISSGMPWWKLSVAAAVIIVGLGIWIKIKVPSSPL